MRSAIDRTGSFAAGLAAISLSLTAPGVVSTAAAADTVKLGYIDPLSGGGASVGERALQHLQYLAAQDQAKRAFNGATLEILPLDNKTNPQESVVDAQKAADAGARYLTQGNGSAVAAAIIDFVNKYNRRNPGKELLYFNYAAVDPAFTNEKCSYWHFRWDANSDIKMAALTNFIKARAEVKKVYLINQDYSFGKSVRTQARAMLKTKRPDIEIVGDELHPLLKVNDFTPYVAKIKASGADTVITGNWGQDIALLLKAAADAGLKTDWYTYYAGGPGGPTAIKQANLSDRVFAIAEGNPNGATASAQEMEAGFRAKYNGASMFYPRLVNEMWMFEKATEEAKSNEPKAVAAKLEDMRIKGIEGDEIWMRKEDHQLFQDLYIVRFGPPQKGAKFEEEKTGWAWSTIAKIPLKDTILPTTCKMERPSAS